MRKFILMVLIAFLLSIVVSASYSLESNTEEKMISKLSAQLNEEEKALLYNKELYESNVDVENKVIIKVYDTLTPLSKCMFPIGEIVDWAESIDTITYVVLNENNDKLRICNDEKEIRIVVVNTNYKDVTFAEDLKSFGGTVEIFNETYSVEAVHCFDDLSSHGGFYAYYVTDGGIFVRYYENEFAKGTWFTESDFAKYGTAYYNYITSYEYNYNENGELLYGTVTLFSEYISNIYGTDKDYGAKDSENQHSTETTESDISKGDQNSSIDSSNQSSDTDLGNQTDKKDSNVQSGTTDTSVTDAQNTSENSSNATIVVAIALGTIGVTVIIIVAVVLLKKFKVKQ